MIATVITAGWPAEADLTVVKLLDLASLAISELVEAETALLRAVAFFTWAFASARKLLSRIKL